MSANHPWLIHDPYWTISAVGIVTVLAALVVAFGCVAWAVFGGIV